MSERTAVATPPEDDLLEAWAQTRRRSALAPFVDAMRLVVRDRFALVGIVIIGLLFLAALLAGVLAPHDPYETLASPDTGPSGGMGVARLLEPSREFWLGTTSVGRDVLSQLLFGTRVAFIVGMSAAVAVGIVSTLLGLLSGYYGKHVDDIIMRSTDIALSVPTLPLAIVAVAIVGSSLRNIIIVITLLFWRNGARIVRSAVLTEKEKVYVQAARAAGASHPYIMRVHILPNIIPVAFLWMTMSIAFAILAEASLSFLGLGDPNAISWGQMLNGAFTSGSIRTAWWWVLPPSVCLVLLISSIYVVGRAWEETTNPRLRRR